MRDVGPLAGKMRHMLNLGSQIKLITNLSQSTPKKAIGKAKREHEIVLSVKVKENPMRFYRYV